MKGPKISGLCAGYETPPVYKWTRIYYDEPLDEFEDTDIADANTSALSMRRIYPRCVTKSGRDLCSVVHRKPRATTNTAPTTEAVIMPIHTRRTVLQAGVIYVPMQTRPAECRWRRLKPVECFLHFWASVMPRIIEIATTQAKRSNLACEKPS